MIARKTWRELLLIAFAYVLILEMLAVPVLLLWPDIYADLQRSTLFRTLGVDWIKRLGEAISGDGEQMAYLNWCAVMLLFRSCNLVGTAAAVLIGTGLFARERENNTLEFLLARPVSRGSMLWQKFWPAAVIVTVPIFLVNASAIPWSWTLELDLPKWEL
ncbi:MAG: ABC transporter permease, partial [Planctomycetota bacterium]